MRRGEASSFVGVGAVSGSPRFRFFFFGVDSLLAVAIDAMEGSIEGGLEEVVVDEVDATETSGVVSGELCFDAGAGSTINLVLKAGFAALPNAGLVFLAIDLARLSSSESLSDGSAARALPFV